MSAGFSAVNRPPLQSLDFGKDLLRQNLIDDPNLAGTAIRINILPYIFLGEFVDMGIRSVFRDLHYRAFNGEVSIRVFRILNTQGYVGIAPHVQVFGTAFGAVDDDMLSIVFTPYGRDLRRTVPHERRQLTECFLLEQIAEVLGNRGHFLRLLISLYSVGRYTMPE